MADGNQENNLREKLRSFWSGEIHFGVAMAGYTTLKVGGPAAALVAPTRVGEIITLLDGCRRAGIPSLVVGGGSNLLVADEGFAGLVIILGRDFAAIRTLGEDGGGRNLVEVEAGCRLPGLLGWCRKMGFAGLEFMAGIPGTVGGAVVMNAGAWGREVKDVLASLTCLESGGVVSRDRTELDFEYRSWHRPVEVVVLSATFALTVGDGEKIAATCRDHLSARKSRQPTAFGSAGSFFKNPPGFSAGRLIEEAGLKGLRVGGAEVSAVHGNFIVNVGGATAGDFLTLMELVQARVREQAGVRLEPEVKIVGAAGEQALGHK